MVSSVKSVPNHYQTLGLSPTASDQEIAAAFSRAMGSFGGLSITGAARIGAAFEVLRSPSKRRAYDRAIGLSSEPRSYQWPINATARSNAGLMGSAWSNLAKQVAGDDPPVPVERLRHDPILESDLLQPQRAELRHPGLTGDVTVAARLGDAAGQVHDQRALRSRTGGRHRSDLARLAVEVAEARSREPQRRGFHVIDVPRMR